MADLIIDWEKSTKIAGNNLTAAKDFLLQLSKILPEDLLKITHAYSEKNLLEMQRLVHALHGALCYCSVPRLKNATMLLEKALQQKSADIHLLFSQFKQEAINLIDQIQE
jgi:HPt (histidine-containing phosphotransfer) domain-containing protein